MNDDFVDKNTEVSTEPTHRKRLHIWQRQSVNLLLHVNHKRLEIHVRFIEISRRTRIIMRLCVAVIAVVTAFTVVIPAITYKLAESTFPLSTAESALLPDTDSVLEKDISYNNTDQTYQFQDSQKTPTAQESNTTLSSGINMIKASIPKNPSTGITVTDPINNVDFKITPDFSLASARQSTSHIYYPFANGEGQLVYSPQATDVLEDLVLRNATSNTLHFDYNLNLGSSFAARMEPDGSVNVYGSELSSLGHISTDNASDAARVQKAENRAQKDKLLFSIPAPDVTQAGKGRSNVKASYSLLDNGNTLRITATNLMKASYPLDIDPTVTVQSVAQLYRDTNGESNVDFNVTNGTINRGAVTGGVLGYTAGWTANSHSLQTARFLESSVVSNGYMYAAGGDSSSTTNLSSIEVAQISSADNTVGSFSYSTALPGSGTQQELSEFRLLTYNGYLYVVGGSTGTDGCSSSTADIWYNPTQPNGQLASTWTAASNNLSTGLCGFGATIYDNYIYIIGGQTGTADSSAVTTVDWAPILPDGDIGTWATTTATTNLPSSLYDEDVQVYNGYIYAIGGINSSGTVESTIYSAALNSTGGIFAPSSGSSWTSLSNTFSTADTGLGITNLGGGSFTAVNDGYMYVSGGCTVITVATPTCTTISTQTYVAQINADGTLGVWAKVAVNTGKTDAEVGGSLTVFGGYLYIIGGCTVMPAHYYCTSGDTLADVYYAQIQSAGQIGPVAVASGDTLPIDVYQNATVVNNGYIYLIGGCITLSCDASSGNTTDTVYYTTISASGTIGSWGSPSTFTLNAAGGGLGAIDEAATVYDNYIYIFGGYNYKGNTDGSTGTWDLSASKNVWYAPVSATTGNLTANFTAYTTTTLTNAAYSMSAVDDGQYIFGIGGGWDSSNDTTAGINAYFQNGYRLTAGTSGPTLLETSATYVHAINTAEVGSSCTSIYTAYPADCYPGNGAMAIAYYNGYVYLAGGASSGNGQSVVIQYDQVNSSGELSGAWTDATNYLPTALRRTSAYAYNGYLYVVGGHDGDTNVTEDTVDIGAINTSTGNLNASGGILTSSSQLADAEWDGSVGFADGTVFVSGGCYGGNPPASCTAMGGDMQTFQLYNADNDGTGTWDNGTAPTSTNTVGAGGVAYNGYLYEAGGCSSFTFSYTLASSTCATDNATYNYTSLDPDGSIPSTGGWMTTPGTLSGGKAFGCLLATNGYLYYIGGQTGADTTASTAVYYSQIGSNGAPGTWTSGTALPISLTQMGCDSFDGTLYVTGGLSGATPTYENTIYYAQPSGGTITWNNFSTTKFTNARAGLNAVAAGGYLYIMGGYNGATYYNDVQFIAIDPATGNFSGSWATTSNVPIPTAFMTSVVANGYMFLFGGNTSTACANDTYIAPIQTTGQLGYWTDGIDNFANARTGAASGYYNGYYYLIGGDTCSAIVSSSVVQYGGEQSESMQSFFTRYADLGGDAAPELFLAFVTNAENDGDNIEYWQMNYITSTYETNSWGANTLVPNLTSGTVTSVYAYDSSDTNVYLNRYVQLAFNITETKSFTFPDANPPSVNSYFMYYSPAPQTRLRNGEDFQDEQQQGFDLNY